MFDCNVIVSAALKQDGVPRMALASALEQGHFALSPDVFAEMTEVLARPKFARAISRDGRLDVLTLLAAKAVWFYPEPIQRTCRDEGDDKYLALALTAAAQVIVSGDADLLVLDGWQGIRILRAADFLAWTPP